MSALSNTQVLQVQSYQGGVQWGMAAGTGWLALLATLIVVVKLAKG